LYEQGEEMGKRSGRTAKSRRIRLTFVDEGISAEADMLDHLAPRTCQGIWDRLPVQGEVVHAIYSGSEIVYHFPKMVSLPDENQTSRVLPGDIAYFAMKGGRSFFYPEDFSEICWFYDRDACPSCADGPVQVNVFARIAGDLGPFYEVCRRIRREGFKILRFSRV
jgi:hypothetical protein